MASPVMVTFIRDNGPYGAGDMAGFDAASAKVYVEQGLAVYLTTKVEEAPVTKDATPDEVSDDETPAKKKRASRLKKRRGE